ncbi:cytochrome-c oxidase, cbb3-type subunit III [Spiribacter sp. C176]|uniref:Cbb3-type cytochrome c oxidase subunit n=1 Tax=Spiribacter salilacus TaxID=2664894 RepID=A0A6N7QU94_9GAMM|nr:cytochrome-c oxidase, cbb3-type subunit III [Spiribacter salilacus]MRH78943.1 cytochrome-c oxidase, cbb3-type subunit III [Spiribacter salilacus]
MSLFWSLFIIVLTLGNIFACWWLIRWTAKPRAGEAAAHETTGHVWDGDLTEYNNPMPRWWLWLFYITIVFGLAYLLFFPGLGNFKGLLGWSQYGLYEAEMAAAEERFEPIYAAYAEIPVPTLASDSEAMATAGRLFANNCATCHGSDGRGARGYPNLSDGVWQWGGSPEAIRHTLINGRQAVMPAFAAALSETELEATAAYVYSLSGREAPARLVAAGREHYQTLCIACHGAEGKGNEALGAPNLTDNTWLYGGSLAAITETLNQGRNGIMPAFAESLGENRVHLVTAYVYRLSGGEENSDDELAAR